MASLLDPAAVLIGLREGLEACLVTGILLGMMRRFGHPRGVRLVWLGAGAGGVASVLLALLIQSGVAGFRRWYSGSGGQEMVELATGLVALGILTYMVVWMQRHTSGLMGSMRGRLVAALAAGRWSLVASLSFLVVVREGLETVLFFAARAAETPWSILALSGALGLAASAGLAVAIFRLTVRVNFERFFVVTGYLLILLAAGVLVGTVQAGESLGQDHGLWTASPPAWDLRASFAHEEHCLDQTLDVDSCPPAQVLHANWAAAMLHTLVGYEDHPSRAQAVGYVAYVGGLGGWYAWTLGKPRAAALRGKR